MFRSILASLLMLTPAIADETWQSEFGTIVYEDEIDGTAVFSVPTANGTAWMYIDGLAGNYDQRIGIFKGVWIIEADGPCTSSLLTADGRGSSHWGTLELVWDGPAFPSGWSARLGTCAQTPFDTLRANLPDL